jgi:hypothetical protein
MGDHHPVTRVSARITIDLQDKYIVPVMQQCIGV